MSVFSILENVKAFGTVVAEHYSLNYVDNINIFNIMNAFHKYFHIKFHHIS